MPYIEQSDRDKFLVEMCHGKEHLAEAIGEICKNSGELNYVFTVISQMYLKTHGLKYQNINDIIGALEGCKQEIYRRIAAPYEDEKISLNGDVNLLNDPSK